MSSAPDPSLDGSPSAASPPPPRYPAEVVARLSEQLAGQQRLWAELVSFIKQVHGTLDPTRVAFLVANEGCRLVECDRISVAVRQGNRTRIAACGQNTPPRAKMASRRRLGGVEAPDFGR